MADLIDRQALQGELDKIVKDYIADKSFQCNFAAGIVCDIRDNVIAEMPAVDAVEVVRCRDCKWYEVHKPSVLENCERKGMLVPMMPDDFCSYGERKDDGT